MSIIAITGSLCSGKTAVLKILKTKGAKAFSADQMIHNYYKDKTSLIYRKVARCFPGAVDESGRILRNKLGKIVFADTAKLKALEEIAHPQVIKDMREWVEQRRKKRGVYIAEVPLLFEKKLDKIFNKIILVYAPQSILSSRIGRNFGLSRREALERLKLFLPLKDKKRRADFLINNNSNINELKRKVGLLWCGLKKM